MLSGSGDEFDMTAVVHVQCRIRQQQVHDGAMASGMMGSSLPATISAGSGISGSAKRLVQPNPGAVGADTRLGAAIAAVETRLIMWGSCLAEPP